MANRTLFVKHPDLIQLPSYCLITGTMIIAKSLNVLEIMWKFMHCFINVEVVNKIISFILKCSCQSFLFLAV